MHARMLGEKEETTCWTQSFSMDYYVVHTMIKSVTSYTYDKKKLDKWIDNILNRKGIKR